jgi:capsular polysaccharide biosynthesis protein
MIADSQQRTLEADVAGDEYVFSLRPLLGVVWKRFWIIVLVMVLFSVVAVGLSLQQTPLYEASNKILVGRGGGFILDPTHAEGLELLAVTMSEAVDSRPVAKAAIRQQDLKLSPKGLLSNLQTKVIPQTQFIEVSYVDSNPERAKQIVNAVGNAFSEKIFEVSQSADDNTTVSVWDPAITPVDPISPTPWRDGFIALVLGGFVGLGLVFLLEHLDDSWRSSEEAEQISGVPTIGVIPRSNLPNASRKRVG